MVSQVNATGNQDIDGLLWGYQWDSNEFPGGNLTFSFPTNTAVYGGYGTISGFEAFNAAQQTAVRQSFAMIGSYITVGFTEVAPGDASWMRFAEADVADGTTVSTAFATPPGSATYKVGDSWYNHTYYNSPGLGTFGMQAGIMHEIGHNMGLKHGHTSQTAHSYLFPTLPTDHDSYEYSVMTYRQYVGDNNGGDNAPHHATTYMINDIAAMQYMYGANFNTNSGNTTYSWNATTGENSINGVAQGASVTGNYIFMSIWDGNGVDTYDLSNFGSGMTINLAPGAYSIVPGFLANLGDGHFARGSIYNAYQYNGDVRSLVENAMGGAGNDTIYGNAANNTLYGNGGADTIHCFDGNDTVLGGNGGDTIYGGSGVDTLVGEGGGDLIYGGSETDYIDGRQGQDQLFGGDGVDVLFGDGLTTTYGYDSDTIHGDAGDDIIMGESGDHTAAGALDVLYGDAGNDTIFGGGGADWIYGGDGNDVIDGGLDSDFIVGGAGSDIMLGSGNSAYGAASAGGDLFSYSSIGDAGDSIYGFDFNAGTGRDGIDFSSLFDSFGYFGSNPRADGIMYVFQNSGNIDVYCDPNGPAGGVNLVRMFTIDSAVASALNDTYFLF